ncbi:uncharacterized protein lacc1 isoform X6 [Syngnathus acus]|uniref:uncharacterized protein lacc1 isoform X6 n=1 Tax=Syngnathus acus TaxID=161584 RepID=UPI0018860D62|nr:uncharacterized protein lacc1 isoform X6 [Syngnathus acus]
MSESAAAVLLDLAHACRCGCTERLFREEAAAATADAHLLVLCAGSARSAVVDASVRAWSGGGGARVLLDWRATAACAYRLKRAADEAGVLWLRVITSPRGRALLLGYERALFTALYKFTYRLGCGPRPLRGADTPVRQVEGDVTVLLQALPAVGGAIRLLTSTLIPECFGHGFSTRAGGVSLVPTLSSLNLFSSPRRRDSAALVNENQRRLALHAGFYPRPLQMLKVGTCRVLLSVLRALLSKEARRGAGGAFQSCVGAGESRAGALRRGGDGPARGGPGRAGRRLRPNALRRSRGQSGRRRSRRLERNAAGRRHGNGVGHGDRAGLRAHQHPCGLGPLGRAVLLHAGAGTGRPLPAGLRAPFTVAQAQRGPPTGQQAAAAGGGHPGAAHPGRPQRGALHVVPPGRLLLARAGRSPLWHPGGLPVA